MSEMCDSGLHAGELGGLMVTWGLSLATHVSPCYASVPLLTSSCRELRALVL